MKNHFWWNSENCYEDIFSLVRTLDNVQNAENSETLTHYRLYGNMDAVGMDYFNYSKSQTASLSSRVRINIIESMCDTVTNKITKNKPRVKFLTSGADASLQKASKLLEKFTDGMFYKTKIHESGQMAFRDATIDGTGFVKLWRDGADICAERQLPIEIVIDNNEGLYAKPRNLYQKKWVPKEVLKIQYPDQAKMIDKCSTQGTSKGYSFTPANTSKLPEMVLVIEAWHLPSKKDKSDGKHIICIENAILAENEWKKDYFPFAIIRWKKKSVGFKGQGLAYELKGLQIEINKTLRTIQLANELNGVPRVLIESQSKIVQDHINNAIGAIIEYDGTKPDFVAPTPVHPDMYSWFEKLYQKAYEIAGVSQMAASAKKPPGIDSGIALREMNDIETERFITVGQAYENFFMDCARQFIDLAREIEADETIPKEEKVSVQVKGRRYLETIKWSDISLEENQYQMQMFPASGLSNTPAGRKQDVQDLINLGVIQKEDAADLLNIPDIEGFMTSETASVRDIKFTIEKIIEDGEYSSPEPFQNLKYGIKAFMSAYLNAKWDNVDEDRLELLRKWIKEANIKLKQATEEEMALQQQIAMQQQQPTNVIQSANSEVESFL